MNYHKHVEADARLIILKELAQQPDGRLNSGILGEVLISFGHNRSRDWLHTQLHALEDIGAVRLMPVGSVIIASITHAGLDHVHRRTALSGVARPSPAVD